VDSKPRIDEVARAHGAGDRADAKVQELSKGMQQKIQFIGSILHEPEIVILDEPFSGLDPINQRVLREIIIGAEGGGPHHHLQHAHHRACRAHLRPRLHHRRGEKVADGTMQEVKHRHGAEYVALRLQQWPRGPACRHQRAWRGVDDVRGHGDEVEWRCGGADPQALLEQLLRAGVRLRGSRSRSRRSSRSSSNASAPQDTAEEELAMSRIVPIIKREFTQAVTSKAFIIGTMLGPLLIVGMFGSSSSSS
jgi:ABC-2 type transport system ATP-binding protein